MGLITAALSYALAFSRRRATRAQTIPQCPVCPFMASLGAFSFARYGRSASRPQGAQGRMRRRNNRVLA
jgi:hypothetical protein